MESITIDNDSTLTVEGSSDDSVSIGRKNDKINSRM